jgi:hypothetical protein
VFHSWDKLTSFTLHFKPMLLEYCIRWRAPRPGLAACFDSSYSARDFGVAAALYLVWQALYAVKTEVLDRKFLDQHPEYLTSLRCLTLDQKNFMNKLVLAAMRRMGIMAKTELFDPSSAKTKLIFMMSQFIYTAIIMLIIPIIYSSYLITSLCVLTIAWSGVYNGSSYYIDVFSHRYQLQFEQTRKAASCSEQRVCTQAAPAGASSSEAEDEKLKAS